MIGAIGEALLAAQVFPAIEGILTLFGLVWAVMGACNYFDVCDEGKSTPGEDAAKKDPSAAKEKMKKNPKVKGSVKAAMWLSQFAKPAIAVVSLVYSLAQLFLHRDKLQEELDFLLPLNELDPTGLGCCGGF